MIGKNSNVYPVLLEIVAPDPMYESVIIKDDDERDEVYNRFHNKTDETTWEDVFGHMKDKDLSNKLIELFNALDLDNEV